MATVPSVPVRTHLRHPLGWPAGSIRALLALAVLALSWAVVLLWGRDRPLPLMFVYLQALLLLILLSFHAAHGRTIGAAVSPRSPLGLPRGSIRFLLLAGYAGLAVFLYYHNHEFDLPPRAQGWFVLLLLTSGFFVGHIVSRAVQTLARGTEPFWYQDILAWIALLATIAMTAVVIVHLFINPSLQPTEQLDMPSLESFLAAAVGFYFGARA